MLVLWIFDLREDRVGLEERAAFESLSVKVFKIQKMIYLIFLHQLAAGWLKSRVSDVM